MQERRFVDSRVLNVTEKSSISHDSFTNSIASGHVTNCGACTTLLLIPTGRARRLLTQQ